MATEIRKIEHLKICLKQQVETGNPLWEEVSPAHQALPDLGLDAIETSCSFFGKNISLFLFIARMTEGRKEPAIAITALPVALKKYIQTVLIPSVYISITHRHMR